MDFAQRIVIPSLLDAVGWEGLVIMPALTGTTRLFCDLWIDQQPAMWGLNTPSRIGRLSEVFGKYDLTIRSVHPTHSVFVNGNGAEDLVSGHVDSKTPCGFGSPYEKFGKMKNSKILLIGVNLRSCTFIHYLEEVHGAPGHMSKEEPEVDMEDLGIRKFKVHANEWRLPRAVLRQKLPGLSPAAEYTLFNPFQYQFGAWPEDDIEPDFSQEHMIEALVQEPELKATLKRVFAGARAYSSGYFVKDFSRLREPLMSGGCMKQIQVGNAICTLIFDLAKVSEIFRRLLDKDRYFLRYEGS